MIKQFMKLLKALNSGTNPSELALACVAALFCAFTFTPFNFLVFTLLMMTLRANISMYFAGVVFFKILAVLLDPVGDKIGYAILTAPQLHGAFTGFSKTPVAPFTDFNNTLVMGGLVMAAALALPVYFISKGLIVKYRKNIQQKIEKAKVVKLLNLGKFVDFLKGGEEK